MPRAEPLPSGPSSAAPVVASVDESVAISAAPVAVPATPPVAVAVAAAPSPMPAPALAASAATLQQGAPAPTMGKGAAPQPAPAVVMAREIPTTNKGPGSREAIVIGFAHHPNKFQTSMMDAPCTDPGYFCFGCLCPCLAACHLRKKMLGDNFATEVRACVGAISQRRSFSSFAPSFAALTLVRWFAPVCLQYSCCQMESVGYQPCCYSNCACFKDCPDLGLCLEAWCCTGCSLSFTRIHAMHKWQLAPDPMDYTCIQFSNCMQLMRCVCDILAIFNKSFEQAAHCVDCAADCAFHITAGCMLAQTNHEVNYRAMPNAGVAVAVPSDGQSVLQATAQPGAAAAPQQGQAHPLTQTLLPSVVDMER
eukprot:COSAG06_NODE_806_length_12168_cov_195.038615_7_plen_365_part_00